MTTTATSLDDIRAAREVIRGRLHRTPMLTSRVLGERAGVALFLKAENLQKTGAFKVRGVLEQASPPVGRGEAPGPDHDLGRQPRPGAGLRRGCRGAARDDRDAGQREFDQGRGMHGVRRGGRRRRHRARGVRESRGAPARARVDPRPPVQRSVRDRRPGHRRARDPRGRAGRRHRVRRDRRRGPDLRGGRRDQAEPTPRAGHRGRTRGRAHADRGAAAHAPVQRSRCRRSRTA